MASITASQVATPSDRHASTSTLSRPLRPQRPVRERFGRVVVTAPGA
jgi:hypothetical protein